MYECPGLAPVSAGAGRGGAHQLLVGTAALPTLLPGPPKTCLCPLQTGEMEVRNPLFDHSSLTAPLPPPPPPQ